MCKKIEKGLEEYHWLKLGEARGIVKAKSGNLIKKSNGLNLGVLPTKYEFSESGKVTINLCKPIKIIKLFIRVMGPNTIFNTKHFMEEVFDDLIIDVSMGKESQEVLVVRKGELNRKELVLMGKIKDWMMYYWAKFNTIRFDYTGTLPVNIVVHGKTGSPHTNHIDFILQLYVKTETL